MTSGHIAEDIGQTCRDIAVSSQGRVLFRGSLTELTQAATGHVWLMKNAGQSVEVV